MTKFNKCNANSRKLKVCTVPIPVEKKKLCPTGPVDFHSYVAQLRKQVQNKLNANLAWLEVRPTQQQCNFMACKDGFYMLCFKLTI